MREGEAAVSLAFADTIHHPHHRVSHVHPSPIITLTSLDGIFLTGDLIVSRKQRHFIAISATGPK
jgi:hypothetical protein